MKKITLTLNIDQMAFLVEYLKWSDTWNEKGLQHDKMDPMQKLLMTSTGSILQKMAINYAIKLHRDESEYKIVLKDGRLEALYAYFIIEPCKLSHTVRNQILMQIEPQFNYPLLLTQKSEK